MICKHLVNTVKLKSGEREKEPVGCIELEYYLLESDQEYSVDEPFKKRIYGVEIVKRENRQIESQVVRDITPCREDACQILDKLANNTVTPMELKFILDDIIGVWG